MLFRSDPSLDSWISINRDGTVTVRTGKVEIGQGIKTAVAIVAAEELDVALARIRVQCADTALTPDEGTTSGSQSMQNSASAIRQAAAECRQVLLTAAAEALKVPAEDLMVEDGTVRSRQTNRQTDYWTLFGGKGFDRNANSGAKPKSPYAHKLVGGRAERLDLPAKVFGETVYVQDMDLPGMVHGRVIRPTSQRQKLASVDAAKAAAMPGVIGVHRDGGFLAVVAATEIEAVRARAALAEAATWTLSGEANPDEDRLYDWLLERKTIDKGVVKGVQADEVPPETPAAADAIESVYAKPYILQIGRAHV